MLESIVVHTDIMSAQYRITNNHEHGKTFKERTKNSERGTGGAIFRNDSSRLGQTILEVKSEIKETVRVKR